jgi:hypothetical protein
MQGHATLQVGEITYKGEWENGLMNGEFWVSIPNQKSRVRQFFYRGSKCFKGKDENISELKSKKYSYEGYMIESKQKG